MNYIRYGKGKCLIFLHGWGGSIASFKGVADYFAQKYCVILVDLAGFGQTPQPDFPYRLDDYVSDIAKLLKALDIKECILIGHSFGGRVAMRLASMSSLVKGLVLVDSAGMPPKHGLKYYFKVANYKIRKKLSLKIDGCGSKDYLALSGIMRKTFVNIVNENNLKDVEKISVPTLLFWGKYDKDTPLYMLNRLGKQIKGARKYLVNGGHFSYLDEPQIFRRVLSAFLEEI